MHLLISITSRSYGIFTQQRINQGLRPFRIIKFKTMNDRKGLDGQLLSDKELITTVGSLLGITSLDELPELIHVLAKDMDFIVRIPWISNKWTPSPLLPGIKE